MLSFRTGLALAGALATLGSCTIANRIDADRDKWRTEAGDWKHAAGRWEAAYRRSEGFRADEGVQAAEAVRGLRRACDADISAVRKHLQARNRLHAKPVKFDAKNCPLREVWKAADMDLAK